MNMKIVVQKFGGTSVSTKDRRKNVIRNIREAIKEGFSPVVVVSAMGRKGEPYATDTLLSLVTEEFNNELLKKNSLVYGKTNHTSTYAWKLTNIKKYDKKIPCKGKLGLWNYE